MKLNNRFNTDGKPILQSLIEEAGSNSRHDLPDHMFNQAINEYGLRDSEDEEAIMREMYDCKTHKFKRYSEGWTVEAKGKKK